MAATLGLNKRWEICPLKAVALEDPPLKWIWAIFEVSMSKEKVMKSVLDPKVRMCSKEFTSPDHDQALYSGYMAPGDVFGVGHRQPVGKFKASSIENGPIPQESVCFPSKEAIR